jgi:hypothetical protein
MGPASPATFGGAPQIRRICMGPLAFEISRRARLAPCRETSNVCVIGAANRAPRGGPHMSLDAELKVAKYREKRS